MLKATNLSGFGIGAEQGPPTLTYLGKLSLTTNSNVYNPLGTITVPRPGQLIVFVMGGFSGGQQSGQRLLSFEPPSISGPGITFNGELSEEQAAPSEAAIGWGCRAVEAGDVDISVIWNLSTTHCVAFICLLENYQNIGNGTIGYFGITTTGGLSAIVNAEGFFLVAVANETTNGFSWDNGAVEVDAITLESVNRYEFGFSEYLPPNSGTTIDIEPSNSANNTLFIGGSFK